MKRRTAVEVVPGDRELRQVRYFDPVVRVWCDFGDPVPVVEADVKPARCRLGLAP